VRYCGKREKASLSKENDELFIKEDKDKSSNCVDILTDCCQLNDISISYFITASSFMIVKLLKMGGCSK
jgi:hypothetical protein